MPLEIAARYATIRKGHFPRNPHLAYPIKVVHMSMVADVLMSLF
jgi:hypothetical protein